jgi:hypothetical protein
MFPRKDKDFKVKSSIPRSLLLGSSYSDYLLVSTRKAMATGLSELVDEAISHGQITRFLAGEGRLIFDDTTVEKAYYG